MTPPRLATWLLFAFGSGPDLETIAGDLAEQYPSRTAAWYWRQVAYAIVVSGVGHLRAHWVRALGAIWLGGLVIGVTSFALQQLAYVTLPMVIGPPIAPTSWPVLLLTVTCPAFITGWVLAVVYRPHGAPFVVAFAMVAVHVTLLPRLVFLARNSLEHERFVPYLLTHVFSTIPSIGCALLLGACLGTLAAQRFGLPVSR